VKTILIFPFNLLSHYLRCLVLADSYDKNEYNILFLSSSVYDGFVRKNGYQTFNCDQFDSSHVMDCAARFDFSWLNEQRLEDIFLSQVAVIHALKADIVIGDMAPSLKMAAEFTNTKYLCLMNGYMSRYYAITRKVPRAHRARKYLQVLPEILADSITDIAEKITFRLIHAPFKKLRKKYALSVQQDYIAEMEGDSNLICDLPELFPQRRLPANYAYAGPLVYNFGEESMLWLDEIAAGTTMICVSMGSTGDWEKLKFLNDPYYARYTIITAGDVHQVLSAPHIISRNFVNLPKLLHKASLMICHGGNGTIYPALLSNVYMFCVSSHFEQEWNMNALEKKGYGKSADDFDDETWKKEIYRYLRC